MLYHGVLAGNAKGLRPLIAVVLGRVTVLLGLSRHIVELYSLLGLRLLDTLGFMSGALAGSWQTFAVGVGRLGVRVARGARLASLMMCCHDNGRRSDLLVFLFGDNVSRNELIDIKKRVRLILTENLQTSEAR